MLRLILAMLLALSLIVIRPAMINDAGMVDVGDPTSSSPALPEVPEPEASPPASTPTAVASPSLSPSTSPSQPPSPYPSTPPPPSTSAAEDEPVRLTDLSPRRGPISGGTTVVIAGSGLQSVRWIWFGDFGPVEVSDRGQNSITVVTPPVDIPRSARSSRLSLSWAGRADAERTDSGLEFTFEAAPIAATRLKPNRGPLSGGNKITIVGSGLEQVTDVIFSGNEPGEIVNSSATSIVVVVPRGRQAGRVKVTLIGPSGSGVSAPTYTYLSERSSPDSQANPGGPGNDDRIEVNAASPTSGPMTGGTAVTITGRNLASVTRVRFGDTAADIATQSSSTLVVIAPPAASDFAVNIILEHAKGGVEAARFQYVR